MVAVHFLKQFGVLRGQANYDDFQPNQELSWRNISVQSFHLQNFHLFWIICNVIGFIMYFGVGGFLHASIQSYIYLHCHESVVSLAAYCREIYVICYHGQTHY